jgi:hypothetical protein
MNKFDTMCLSVVDFLDKGIMLPSHTTSSLQLKYKSSFYSVMCNKLMFLGLISPINNKQIWLVNIENKIHTAELQYTSCV